MGLVIGLIILLIGLFAIGGAVLDWNLFMESTWPALFSRILGSRTRGRVVYAIIGIVVAVYGIRVIFLFLN